MQQTLLDEDDMHDAAEPFRRLTPMKKMSRSDVHFPLTTPRRPRAPSIGYMSDLAERKEEVKLTIRARGVETETESNTQPPSEWRELPESRGESRLSIKDLPMEVQRKVLDYIFGEVHSVNTNATPLRGKSVSSSMRHPRRKAVSDLALVSDGWRDLVQERIYRHIKVKGTRAGLHESAEYFGHHAHLTKHIRHIEFWVPVWGDRSSLDQIIPTADIHGHAHGFRSAFREFNPHPHEDNQNLMAINDPTAIFKRSVNSATLSEIFAHIARFFPSTPIFTLEGGHCKKSNMIRHFRDNLLFSPRQLSQLPQIRTFAMRGSWNIMRTYDHWTTVASALPNVEEWHCGYAKPRVEAYDTINQILHILPTRLRHVNISLDGMYSKDNATLSSTEPPLHSAHHHLCESLGRIAPNLESLTFTGKICSCFWTAARDSIKGSAGLASSAEGPRLRSLELVVKSCCRQRVTRIDIETGESTTDELGGVIADGAGISNLIFIRAFERLTLATVQSLDSFSHLQNIRIRFIDLDSPCALLNPYFQLRKNRLTGLWNEEILETLQLSRRGRFQGLEYEELSEGIGDAWKKDGGLSGLYPKNKPKGIKSTVYRVIAEARGS